VLNHPISLNLRISGHFTEGNVINAKTGMGDINVDKMPIEQSFRQTWEEVAAGIRPHVSSDAFQRWFAAIELAHADDTRDEGRQGGR
jgi:hypothetical protein